MSVLIHVILVKKKPGSNRTEPEGYGSETVRGLTYY
jgi:hypothetical protein